MIERQQRQQWEGQMGEKDEAERPVRKLTPKAHSLELWPWQRGGRAD